jgi:hypothetical protein
MAMELDQEVWGQCRVEEVVFVQVSGLPVSLASYAGSGEDEVQVKGEASIRV